MRKHLDDNGRYQKKRATVEIADDAEDRTAQQEWNLLIHELSGSESDELNVEEHPDQTDNGLSVEEEWNLLSTEVPDEEDVDDDDCLFDLDVPRH